MRELAFVVLVAGLVVAGPAAAETAPAATQDTTADAGASGDPADVKQAREKLVDLLFSDEIDRIDFQATTYEEGTALITATADKILEIGVPVLGDAAAVADKAVEVIESLNSSTARGMYATFQKDKQTLRIGNSRDAQSLGEIVGTTISIIHSHAGTAEISYRDRADNLFRRVRRDPDDAQPLLQRYLEMVELVAGLSFTDQAKHLN
jgi:hypothetical protein